jgi:adenosylcobinamide-GDP ribazoletransferase
VSGFAAREARALWTAAIFFTRLPLPAVPALQPDDEARATAYWSLIGAGIGAVVAAAWWVSHRLLPGEIAAGLALAAGLLLTGALHEDGFADVCDGLGGGGTRERVLEIMRDPRIGTFGAIGLVMLIGLKWQVLIALPQAVVPGSLVAAHALSRAAMALLAAALPYARSDGRAARRMVARLDARLAAAVAVGLASLLLVPRAAWPACLLLPALVVIGLGAWFRHRIAGYTGDCLGATQQLTELAVLIGALAHEL